MTLPESCLPEETVRVSRDLKYASEATAARNISHYDCFDRLLTIDLMGGPPLRVMSHARVPHSSSSFWRTLPTLIMTTLVAPGVQASIQSASI